MADTVLKLAPSLQPAKPRMASLAGAADALRGRMRFILLVVLPLIALALGLFFYFMGGRYVSTDDAYVHAAKLMVSTDISGLVSEVDVHEGQTVKAGDVLFRVDPRQFQIALDNAKANLAQTALSLEAMKHDYKRMLDDAAAQQSKVDLDQTIFDRDTALLRNNTVSKADYDQARLNLDSDHNRLESLRKLAEVQLARLGGNPDFAITEHPQYLQAKAQADEAQRQLDHTVVHAPFDGVATQVDALQPGTYLVAQTAALTNTGAIALVATSDVWIDANIKETDLTHVKTGNAVKITVDTYPGHVWSGTVASIAPAAGSEFSILPAQNSSGNWVKVVQRIPVRIRVDPKSEPLALRTGMSVTVEIDTGHRRKLSELF
jgi:membrane fusion protein (multidrug efflux system)